MLWHFGQVSLSYNYSWLKDYICSVGLYQVLHGFFFVTNLYNWISSGCLILVLFFIPEKRCTACCARRETSTSVGECVVWVLLRFASNVFWGCSSNGSCMVA
jgi:hypothetical protein